MARDLRISRESLRPLEITRGQLDQRWKLLSDSIANVLHLSSSGIKMDADYQGEAVWASLVGNVCERVGRQRGRPSFVAPFVELPRRLWAWVGIQEVWDRIEARRFAFRHLGLTIYFGFWGDSLKPQVFRSEWAGLRNWTGAGIAFQASGAGHPHWQFDVGAVLRELSETAQTDAFTESDIVEDFVPNDVEEDVVALIRSATLERMHFASSAPWWNPSTGPHPIHMNAPSTEAELTRWLVACIEYLRQELDRCEIADEV